MSDPGEDQTLDISHDGIVVVEHVVRKLIEAELDHATARLELKLALRRIGHAELADDDDWLNMVLNTNLSLRSGWRHYDWGRKAVILDCWPAQELREVRREPEAIDWRERWIQRGGKITKGRMIALKNDPVWSAISDFGFPFPPFARDSWARTQEVDRATSMRLGLIGRDDLIELPLVPEPRELIL